MMDPGMNPDAGMPRRPQPKGPQSLQFQADIGGVATDFVVTDFGSRLFVVITQNAKLGSLIEASALQQLEDGERTFEVRVLFGDRRQEHYRAYARALIELVSDRSANKSVLLGIQLKEHSPQVFREILNQLKERVVSSAPCSIDDDLAANMSQMFNEDEIG
eukprot:gnl/TRDRNA2_/TRDRNA2_194379_c0_seq1.p1 gnl/TRDRNA2_/TRDRNA2_194379_c0~~gnl/TRDRNA2_/TRDRNA2_194379_c0_seq1.p1  ORF type:complete len:161 (+),score=28.69 gnl/TRDRNA2_/TRDRNA2_194379_c0_seq1:68-550(+)